MVVAVVPEIMFETVDIICEGVSPSEREVRESTTISAWGLPSEREVEVETIPSWVFIIAATCEAASSSWVRSLPVSCTVTSALPPMDMPLWAETLTLQSVMSAVCSRSRSTISPVSIERSSLR